jgi:cytochrome o ubiquinol oxidase subunit III
MKHTEASEHEHYPDVHHDNYSRTTLGFWIYLLSDFVLFGALFATYVVLVNSTFGGPSASDLFRNPFTLLQTFILLVSTLAAGLGGASAHRKQKKPTLVFFSITFVLGVVFMWMQLAEFSQLINAGNSWDRSAFLSAYFTVVGTYTVHIIFGLLWIILLLVPVWREGISHVSIRRLTCLRMFWQFLNIVWIFIFSFVYLLGAKS